MKTTMLILSLMFSSMATAAKYHDPKPNCSARTGTAFFEKDKLASARVHLAKTLPGPAAKKQNEAARAIGG